MKAQQLAHRDWQRSLPRSHRYEYKCTIWGWEKVFIKWAASWHEASNKYRHSFFYKALKFILGKKFSLLAIAPAGTAKDEKIF